jgi:hypothetical protein
MEPLCTLLSAQQQAGKQPNLPLLLLLLLYYCSPCPGLGCPTGQAAQQAACA